MILFCAAEVGDLLERYDLAFAGLAGDPLKAHDDTSVPVLRWHEIVVPGSTLDIHVRTQLLVDAQDNRVLYGPDPSGVLLVSHASELSTDADGSVTWRHCAYTPWIEVDADSGASVDDRPFQRWGSGRAVRRSDGSLALAELSEDELVELPATSDDGCTTAEGVDSTTNGREVGP